MYYIPVVRSSLTKLQSDFRLLYLEIELTAGVIGQQGMLDPPRHLTPPLVYPGVCVCRDAYSS
jgi:hypothetical protein